jgi:uncharacterized membrane protein
MIPTQISIKSKIIAWFLVTLSYLFTFVTPMVAAYYLLAQDKLEEASKGGFFYFLIIGVFGGSLIIAFITIINKQKANTIKTIFRFIVKIAILYGVLAFTNYIDYNITALLKVIYIASGGFIVGSLIEMFAVSKYRDYIREVGVF